MTKKKKPAITLGEAMASMRKQKYERAVIKMADRKPPVKANESSSHAPKIITLKDAVKQFHASDRTLREAVKRGNLTDHRPAGHAKNALLLLDENELAQQFARK